MDAALRLVTERNATTGEYGFNPCFDGCRPATYRRLSPHTIELSFNPCFDGCRPATYGSKGFSMS